MLIQINTYIPVMVLYLICVKSFYYLTITLENVILILHNYEKKKFLSLHYNGKNNFLFVNATKIYQFKAKDSEIKDYICV